MAQAVPVGATHTCEYILWEGNNVFEGIYAHGSQLMFPALGPDARSQHPGPQSESCVWALTRVKAATRTVMKENDVENFIFA